MSRFQALFTAPKRPDDPPAFVADVAPAPTSEPAADSPRELEDNVFNLLPAEPAAETPQDATVSTAVEAPVEQPKRTGGNIHQLATADLSRLSIDNDGRLYWDGKPVEVRRRLELTRAQALGAGIVAGFIAIGAIGAAIQGSLALRDWGCRLGWTTDYCSFPPNSPGRRDIPA